MSVTEMVKIMPVCVKYVNTNMPMNTCIALGLEFLSGGVPDENIVIGRLPVYGMQVYYTDSALEELIEHYSQVEESTVILFFGDHQPALSNDLYRDIYGKDLDDRTMEELMQQYTTPFFLWANFDIEEAQDVSIGTSFLGVLASQLAGYPQTGYMKFLSQLNETFTAITPVGYVLSDGTVYETRDELGEAEQALLDQYEYLQYYNLFGGQTENGFFFVSDPDQSED